ncbi:MAG: IS982 family transposase [Niabella sp.]
MSPSEIMSLVIFYHLSGFKCFKYFYCQGILGHWKSYFPEAVSYNRFIELKKHVNMALYFFIHWQGLGKQTGSGYIDSTKLAVCDNHRIHSHKVFRNIAARGKTSTGWFYGLKLHLVINDLEELMAVSFTAGNVSDNNEAVVQQLCNNLEAGTTVYGDAGYISQKLFENLLEQGVKLITKIRRNMKNKLLSVKEKFMLKRRALVETVIDLLKDIQDLWHTRHRSIDNGFNNMLACLAAYNFRESKPTFKSHKRNFWMSLAT